MKLQDGDIITLVGLFGDVCVKVNF